MYLEGKTCHLLLITFSKMYLTCSRYLINIFRFTAYDKYVSPQIPLGCFWIYDLPTQSEQTALGRFLLQTQVAFAMEIQFTQSPDWAKLRPTQGRVNLTVPIPPPLLGCVTNAAPMLCSRAYPCSSDHISSKWHHYLFLSVRVCIVPSPNSCVETQGNCI